MVLCPGESTDLIDVVVSPVEGDYGEEGSDLHSLQHD